MKALNNIKLLVFIYFANIILFTFIYWFIHSKFPDQFNNENIDPFELFYFSVVTSTTLGYGDIHPCGYFAQAMVMLEVIISIGAFGFMVSAICMKNQEDNYANSDVEEFMMFASFAYRQKVISNLFTVLKITDTNLACTENVEWINPNYGRPHPRIPDLSNYQFEDYDRVDDFYRRMYFSKKFAIEDPRNEMRVISQALIELKTLLAEKEYLDIMSKLWPRSNYASTVIESFKRITDLQEILGGEYNFPRLSNIDSIESADQVELPESNKWARHGATQDVIFPVIKCLIDLYNNFRALNSDRAETYQYGFQANQERKKVG